MPRPVYSDVIAGNPGPAAGNYDLGAPPPGFNWIIKDIVCFKSGPGWLVQNGFNIHTELLVILYSITQPFAYAGYTYHWYGSQVITSGNHLWFESYDAGWSFRISGYVLSLP